MLSDGRRLLEAMTTGTNSDEELSSNTTNGLELIRQYLDTNDTAIVHLNHTQLKDNQYYDYDYNASYYDDFCGDQQSYSLHPLLQPYSIVQLILAFLGIIANVAGICSLLHHRRKHQRDCTSSRALLLISLSMSDMATSIFIPLKALVLFLMMENKLHCTSLLAFYCTRTFVDILIPTCQTITLLNLLGMAVDHWITFIKPFRYFEIMSKKRSLIMIACFWIFTILAAFCEYLTGFRHVNSADYNPDFFCLLSWIDNTYDPEYIVLIIAPFCLIAMTVIYVCISKEINKLVIGVPPRQKDFGQAKRALRMTRVILITFLICWLPCYGMSTTMTIGGILKKSNLISEFIPKSMVKELIIVHQWLFALLMLNSILDPIIYMSHFRMRLCSLCQNVVSKFFSYSLVEQLDKPIETAPPSQSHTMSTMRSSVQFSAGCNILSTEPLVSSGC